MKRSRQFLGRLTIPYSESLSQYDATGDSLITPSMSCFVLKLYPGSGYADERQMLSRSEARAERTAQSSDARRRLKFFARL